METVTVSYSPAAEGSCAALNLYPQTVQRSPPASVKVWVLQTLPLLFQAALHASCRTRRTEMMLPQ